MKVFIGVPVYNGAQQLARCLESLLQQTYGDLEIVVSDNGSTDETLDIARDFRSTDSRIHIIQHSPSGVEGQGIDNCLFLLEQCEAGAFMWAAHDDSWHPQFVAHGVAALEQGFGYFSANWWMGDLDTGIGSSPNTHPLKFVSLEDRVERVVRFVNLHHFSYKDNLHYSLFSTAVIRHVVSRTALFSHFHADATWGALACALATGKTTDEALFFKHDTWILSPDHPRKRSPVTKRLRLLGGSSATLEKTKSLQLDGLILLSYLFPELKTTLRRIYEDQTYDPESLNLVRDVEALVREAHREIDSWDRAGWEIIPRSPLLHGGD